MKKIKKQKTQCVKRRKLEFEDYRHCLEATQLENQIKQPKENWNGYSWCG